MSNKMTNEEFLDKLEELEFTPDNYHSKFNNIEITNSPETLKLELDYEKLYKFKNENWIEVYNQYNNSVELDIFNHFSLGKWEEVHRHGGEGKGDEYYVVLYFPDYDKYIRADAYYSSYNGVSDWDWWYVVKPKEETIIVYNAD